MKKRISSALALLLAVFLLAGCGKSKEVRAVEKSIASIGEVTEETEAAIGDARAQYEALPEEERKSGYAGAIEVAVAVRDGKVVGVLIGRNEDTPGVAGARCGAGAS